MKIIVIGSDEQFEQLSLGAKAVDWVSTTSIDEPTNQVDADAVFILDETFDKNFTLPGKPLFINSVIEPLAPSLGAVRINGWPGFLENNTWEVAGNVTETSLAILAGLGKKAILCRDEPGFISPRVIAMIINEAFFAREDGVSTEPEIDTAMKLGTNYPYGPFEWGNKIGLRNIYTLLLKLAANDERYRPSAALAKSANS
ncbi:MAG: hypothetical protein EOO06_11560 [Chitinophagaceae bacterium]|nr:MAG: hypothetical protein EOO06_11560 [Chitinophagaceae bacterium]